MVFSIVLILIHHFISLKEINISLEDVCHVDEPKRQELYHFAMNGKSFAVIAEHFTDMLQKVWGLLKKVGHLLHLMTFVIIRNVYYDHVLCPVAGAARDSVCQNGPGSENSAY